MSIATLAMPPPVMGKADRSRMSARLRQNRGVAAEAFLRSIEEWEKYAADIRADRDEFIRRELHVFVDYLVLFFSTGDETYRHLYVGEKLKQTFHPNYTREQIRERRKAVTAADAENLAAALGPHLEPADLALLQETLTDIAAAVTHQAKHTCRVLLVGDCLFQDLLSFLTGPCADDDITLLPTFVTSRNVAEIRKDLLALADQTFDLVFYSPFTFDQSIAYKQLQNWRHAAVGGAKLKRTLDPILAEATGIIDVLADLFECNIFVHNSANIRRHDGSLAERAKNLATRSSRARVRTIVNTTIAQHVANKNLASFEHLFVLDEAALLKEHADGELGEMFYHSLLQHPARLGKWLAPVYRDIIATHMLLLKKKLVVCDLDNTLWQGVIGEGAGVTHFSDRQRILKRLQARGVVLAINSKNDPKNVRWDGGVLCENDFVCAQINWDNKVLNIKRIAEFLNLKTKDFVFVDDRVDEREMVKMALPEVLGLDATDDRAWRLLDTWANALAGAGETDRTQFYKQREQRQSFLETQAQADKEDQAKLFMQLGIWTSIREAEPADLKRVAELINRTNQFNLCGSRTSLREVTAWQESPEWKIFVVDAGDKFGSMGTICIMVLHVLPDRIEIPIFVLSCRVFGYGIEHALVSHVRRLAGEERSGGAPLPIVGLYQETPHNEPCRKVYPENGFTWDGQVWRHDGEGEIPGDAKWLRVESD